MKKIEKGLKIVHLGLLMFVIAVVAGCYSVPETFVRKTEPTWARVEVKNTIESEKAWQYVIDVVAKKFELEMISKDGGYIRTSWVHTWWKEGARTENYRVRTIVKFSADWRVVDIKTEANFLDKGQWVLGYDTRLLETVKTDIMGVVGRTTR